MWICVQPFFDSFLNCLCELLGTLVMRSRDPRGIKFVFSGRSHAHGEIMILTDQLPILLCGLVDRLGFYCRHWPTPPISKRSPLRAPIEVAYTLSHAVFVLR